MQALASAGVFEDRTNAEGAIGCAGETAAWRFIEFSTALASSSGGRHDTPKQGDGKRYSALAEELEVRRRRGMES